MAGKAYKVAICTVRGQPRGKYMLRIPDRSHLLAQDGKRCYWFRYGEELLVFISAIVEGDGKSWLHVSVSRTDRIPTYEELAEVKRAFIGAQKKAIQVFPPESEHVNAHPYCLHLWHCLDGDGLPDFTRGRGIL